MATTSNVTTTERGLPDNPALNLALTVMSAVGVAGCTLGVVSKLTFRFVIPVAWKCCLWLADAACLALSLGLLLVSRYIAGGDDGSGGGACRAGGFFTLFGVLDLVSCLALSGFTLVLIQSPAKMSQLSTFKWSLFLGIVLPQKAVTALLAALPVMPLDYFDTDSPYPVACFPIRQEGEKGATFGAILFFVTWGVLIMGIVLAVVLSVRYWAGPDTRVHASSPSLWQMQKLEQARTLHKFSLGETGALAAAVLTLTAVVYTNSSDVGGPQWVALLVLAVVPLVRGAVGGAQFILWSVLCGDGAGQRKEPHHRLKQLQLIRMDGRGRLRMKATWAAGKGVWRRGLLKVYGPAHIKAWAQEIVVLGLLRKSHSASVLQCLWTSNTNPYYETMTLISGDIVTSDSRLTCLELTSSGTLYDLLKSMDVPLPEPCQKTIMHDVAEGLSYLHDQNVLHRNLTSSAVYLKGSVKCFVLRAAVGDFEEAQIYGTLLTGSPNSTMTRKRFFFPDIRSYALVGVEMLARVCECRQREKQPHRRTAGVSGPMGVSPSKHVGVRTKTNHRHHAQKNRDGFSNSKEHSQHNHRPDQDVGDESKTSPGKAASKAARISENFQLSYTPPGEGNQHAAINEAEGEEFGEPRFGSADLSQTSADGRRSDSGMAELDIDRNWKLKMEAKGSSNDAEGVADIERGLGRGWDNFTDSDNDYNPLEDRYKHSRIPGITNVAEAARFEFPNNSVFHAGSGESADDLGIIEEEIERAQRVRLIAVKGGHHQQAGYVTSRTEDGREIFIPAAYAAKQSGGGNSGNSESSGYGSSGGVYGSVNGSSGYSEYHGVHKTTSAATISSFEDDILEVLPGMADVEEKRRGDAMLDKLFKSKRDAKEEGLIESYEDRVRRGELGSNLDDLPDGVVFPKKNRDQQQSITVEELMSGRRANGDDTSGLSQQQPQNHEQQEQQQQQQQQQQNEFAQGQQKSHAKDGSGQMAANKSENVAKTSVPPNRPKTAAAATTTAAATSASISQRLQRGPQRPLSASNTSFREWNARSSLKRNKARAALKRALSGKASQRTPHQNRETEVRGSRAKEIEMKYSNRPRSAMSVLSNTDSDIDLAEEDIVQIKKAHCRSQSVDYPLAEQNLNNTSNYSAPISHNPTDLPVVEESPAMRNLPESTNPSRRNQNHSSGQTVERKPSTKTRPAPPPPPNPSLAPITSVAPPPSAPPVSVAPAPPPAPHTSVAHPLAAPPTSVAHPKTVAVAPIGAAGDTINQFGYDDDPQTNSSPQHPDESFTSVEPASSSKSSSTGNTDNSYSNSSGGVGSTDQQTRAEKIESDMNETINSSVTSGAQQPSGTDLPPGIRLIDSGFDSASVSSEESCLCAAAALQAVDDGDASNPSEIFSQGTCSCACSNCMGSNGKSDERNGSSWTGSQDSESWSNSNSFSSYDANMYRRKLPSSRREKDSPGGVLAPDEQYPSPRHGGKPRSGNSLHPSAGYSPKRNHRRLSHSKGHHPGSSASETSSAASRRYRELVKKGVPLRVSVVTGDGGGTVGDAIISEHNGPLAGNPDNMQDDAGIKTDANSNLFQDLERKGFFERDRVAGSLHMADSPRPGQFGEDGEAEEDIDDDDDEADERYQGLSPIPSLEDIIKEIPDETGQFPDETRAFLNRPESELSVKALQAVLSRTGSAIETKSVHSGELIIDRIFSHQGPSETMASTFGLSRNGLDLDVSAIREVAMLPGPGSPNDLAVGLDIVGLLAGMDGRHVTYCHRLGSQLHLVSVSDLLPAAPHAFEKLRHRLQQTGRVGRIGNQILDAILTCWLYATPPTSAAIVEQLSDRVTETEL